MLISVVITAVDAVGDFLGRERQIDRVLILSPTLSPGSFVSPSAVPLFLAAGCPVTVARAESYDPHVVQIRGPLRISVTR